MPDVISVLIKAILDIFFIKKKKKKTKKTFDMCCTSMQISDILHSCKKITFLPAEVAEE